MKKKELIERLVSEIESGKLGHWVYMVMEIQVNQPLHRNYTKL